ncbi:olfactory receptor 1J4-like [Hemicordylus capensis]|uniref:olfactory receptor 1J4-like n=1 Tax=Hemicordylus capensis TaxID=884348 RepID=UPI002303F329|nr:olfactory receptor 1J4-like [Hemicordylus capensis]
MEQRNQTSEFVLQELFNQTEHEGIIFSILLSMYLLNLLGNLLTALLIRCNARLFRTPMYFFLSYLSLADVGFASSTVPMTLRNLVSQNKVISYAGCLSQMYFFLLFGNCNNFLFAAMAYDRYLAICRPLHYTALMNQKHCFLVVAGCWFLAFLHSMLYTLMLSCHSFCASQEISHFFCDLYPMLEISCSDITSLKLIAMTEGMLDILGPFVLVVISYAHIFLTVMKTPSTKGKLKALSTCGSHLTVVVLFYGNLCWVYLRPTSSKSNQNNLASLMYTVVTPMLNPFIYSLRNSEMKGALRRLVGRMQVSQKNWK